MNTIGYAVFDPASGSSVIFCDGCSDNLRIIGPDDRYDDPNRLVAVWDDGEVEMAVRLLHGGGDPKAGTRCESCRSGSIVTVWDGARWLSTDDDTLVEVDVPEDDLDPPMFGYRRFRSVDGSFRTDQ